MNMTAKPQRALASVDRSASHGILLPYTSSNTTAPSPHLSHYVNDTLDCSSSDFEKISNAGQYGSGNNHEVSSSHSHKNVSCAPSISASSTSSPNSSPLPSSSSCSESQKSLLRRVRPCSLCGTKAVRLQPTVLSTATDLPKDQPIVLLHRLEEGLPRKDLKSLHAYGTIRLLPVQPNLDQAVPDLRGSFNETIGNELITATDYATKVKTEHDVGSNVYSISNNEIKKMHYDSNTLKKHLTQIEMNFKEKREQSLVCGSYNLEDKKHCRYTRPQSDKQSYANDFGNRIGGVAETNVNIQEDFNQSVHRLKGENPSITKYKTKVTEYLDNKNEGIYRFKSFNRHDSQNSNPALMLSNNEIERDLYPINELINVEYSSSSVRCSSNSFLKTYVPTSVESLDPSNSTPCSNSSVTCMHRNSTSYSLPCQCLVSTTLYSDQDTTVNTTCHSSPRVCDSLVPYSPKLNHSPILWSPNRASPQLQELPPLIPHSYTSPETSLSPPSSPPSPCESPSLPFSPPPSPAPGCTQVNWPGNFDQGESQTCLLSPYSPGSSPPSPDSIIPILSPTDSLSPQNTPDFLNSMVEETKDQESSSEKVDCSHSNSEIISTIQAPLHPPKLSHENQIIQITTPQVEYSLGNNKVSTCTLVTQKDSTEHKDTSDLDDNMACDDTEMKFESALGKCSSKFVEHNRDTEMDTKMKKRKVESCTKPKLNKSPIQKISHDDYSKTGIPKIVLTLKGNGPNKEYSCSNRLRNEKQSNYNVDMTSRKHKSKKYKKEKDRCNVKKIPKVNRLKRHLELFGEDSNDSIELDNTHVNNIYTKDADHRTAQDKSPVADSPEVFPVLDSLPDLDVVPNLEDVYEQQKTNRNSLEDGKKKNFVSKPTKIKSLRGEERGGISNEEELSRGRTSKQNVHLLKDLKAQKELKTHGKNKKLNNEAKTKYDDNKLSKTRRKHTKELSEINRLSPTKDSFNGKVNERNENKVENLTMGTGIPAKSGQTLSLKNKKEVISSQGNETSSGKGKVSNINTELQDSTGLANSSTELSPLKNIPIMKNCISDNSNHKEKSSKANDDIAALEKKTNIAPTNKNGSDGILTSIEKGEVSVNQDDVDSIRKENNTMNRFSKESHIVSSKEVKGTQDGNTKPLNFFENKASKVVDDTAEILLKESHQKKDKNIKRKGTIPIIEQSENSLKIEYPANSSPTDSDSISKPSIRIFSATHKERQKITKKSLHTPYSVKSMASRKQEVPIDKNMRHDRDISKNMQCVDSPSSTDSKNDEEDDGKSKDFEPLISANPLPQSPRSVVKEHEYYRPKKIQKVSNERIPNRPSLTNLKEDFPPVSEHNQLAASDTNKANSNSKILLSASTNLKSVTNDSPDGMEKYHESCEIPRPASCASITDSEASEQDLKVEKVIEVSGGVAIQQYNGHISAHDPAPAPHDPAPAPHDPEYEKVWGNRRRKKRKYRRRRVKTSSSHENKMKETLANEDLRSEGDISPSKSNNPDHLQEKELRRRGRKPRKRDGEDSGSIAATAHQEIQKSFDVKHVEERGRRLAQEIKGFNWLEEKIKNSSLNRRSTKLSSQTQHGSSSDTADGKKQSGPSNLVKSYTVPNSPPTMPSSLSTPASPCINPRRKEEFSFRRNSFTGVGLISGLRGHLQTAVPPIHPSSRVQVVPKRRISSTPPLHLREKKEVSTTPSINPNMIHGNTVTNKGLVFEPPYTIGPTNYALSDVKKALIDSSKCDTAKLYSSTNSDTATLYSSGDSNSATLYGVSNPQLNIILENTEGTPDIASEFPTEASQSSKDETLLIQPIKSTTLSSNQDQLSYPMGKCCATVMSNPSPRVSAESNLDQSSLAGPEFSHKHALLKRHFIDYMKLEGDKRTKPLEEDNAIVTSMDTQFNEKLLTKDAKENENLMINDYQLKKKLPTDDLLNDKSATTLDESLANKDVSSEISLVHKDAESNEKSVSDDVRLFEKSETNDICVDKELDNTGANLEAENKAIEPEEKLTTKGTKLDKRQLSNEKTQANEISSQILDLNESKAKNSCDGVSDPETTTEAQEKLTNREENNSNLVALSSMSKEKIEDKTAVNPMPKDMKQLMESIANLESSENDKKSTSFFSILVEELRRTRQEVERLRKQQEMMLIDKIEKIDETTDKKKENAKTVENIMNVQDPEKHLDVTTQEEQCVKNDKEKSLMIGEKFESPEKINSEHHTVENEQGVTEKPGKITIRSDLLVSSSQSSQGNTNTVPNTQILTTKAMVPKIPINQEERQQISPSNKPSLIERPQISPSTRPSPTERQLSSTSVKSSPTERPLISPSAKPSLLEREITSLIDKSVSPTERLIISPSSNASLSLSRTSPALSQTSPSSTQGSPSLPRTSCIISPSISQESSAIFSNSSFPGVLSHPVVHTGLSVPYPSPTALPTSAVGSPYSTSTPRISPVSTRQSPGFTRYSPISTISPGIQKSSPILPKTSPVIPSCSPSSSSRDPHDLISETVRTKYGLHADVDVMPVYAPGKTTVFEHPPQSHVDILGHQKSPILLDAVIGHPQVSDGGTCDRERRTLQSSISYNQQLPSDTLKRSLPNTSVETEIKRTRLSTSDLSEFPPISNKYPPPLKPGLPIQRRYSDNIDTRKPEPVVVHYPHGNVPVFPPSNEHRRSTALSNYVQPTLSPNHHHQLIHHGARRASKEESREYMEAMTLQQHQHPQYQQHINQLIMRGRGPEKATIFPISAPASSSNLRQYGKSHTPPNASSIMEQNKIVMPDQCSSSFFHKFRQKAQQSYDVGLPIPNQEKLQSSNQLEKARQPQTFAPRVLVQEAIPGTPRMPPPPSYSGQHYQSGNPHLANTLPTNQYGNRMHPMVNTNLHHMMSRGLIRVGTPTSATNMPSHSNSTRSITMVSAGPSNGDKKRCLGCPQAAKFLCSGCKKAWYCSEKCQRDHWVIHNSNCVL